MKTVINFRVKCMERCLSHRFLVIQKKISKAKDPVGTLKLMEAVLFLYTKLVKNAKT